MTTPVPMPDSHLTVTLTETQTARLRHHSGKFGVSMTPALDAAGLDDASTLLFDADLLDGHLVAVGIEEAVDGRSDPRAVRLRQNRRLVYLPRGEVESAFGITPDDLAGTDGLPVMVLAGPGVIALREVQDEEVALAGLEELVGDYSAIGLDDVDGAASAD